MSPTTDSEVPLVPPGRNPLVVQPGDVIDGRYRIVQQVADGGMGTVFLAEHLLIKRRVAIKVLHSDLAADTAMIQRFMNEASAAGTLGHPHIVESTDMGFTRHNVPYIVFEYLEGALLTEEIYRTGGLSVRRALRLASQIASALEAAHNAGIVHLDIKSDNVFLTDKGGASDHAKVLDFGISKFMELEGDTQRGLLIGTPEYMAPEQVEAPDTVDKRADIYALGVVLYEMLTARRPFVGTDPRLLLHRIVNEEPPPLGRADLPDGLETLVMDRMLAKDRDQRLESMAQVQAELDGIVERARRDSASPSMSMPTDLASGTGKLPAVASVVMLPPPRTRFRAGWFVLMLLAAGAAGGAHTIDQRAEAAPQTDPTAAIQIDAQRIASSLSSEARSLTLRLQGLAASPLLRAAVETDAATVQDMASSESLFKRGEHETLELVQQRGRVATRLLRLPESSAPVPALVAGARLTFSVADDGTVIISATEPVLRQDGSPGGVLALAAPVDLTLARSLLAADATGAQLTGLGSPVELVAATGSGRTITVPVPLDGFAQPLALSATVPEAPSPPQTFRHARPFALAAVGLFALAFLVSNLLVRRDRRRLAAA